MTQPTHCARSFCPELAKSTVVPTARSGPWRRSRGTWPAHTPSGPCPEADGAYVHTSASALAELAGVTDPRVRQEVDRLIEGGYIVVAHRAGGLSTEDDLMGVSLGVAGARAVGDWHSEVADDVLIERLAAAAEDPELSDEQRSKARALASAAGGAAREVVIKVIGELAARRVMG